MLSIADKAFLMPVRMPCNHSPGPRPELARRVAEESKHAEKTRKRLNPSGQVAVDEEEGEGRRLGSSATIYERLQGSAPSQSAWFDVEVGVGQEGEQRKGRRRAQSGAERAHHVVRFKCNGSH